MTTVGATILFLVLVGAIGVVVELPKIWSHHINQPVQRRRREQALRRKLALAIVTAALPVLIYLAL